MTIGILKVRAFLGSFHISNLTGQSVLLILKSVILLLKVLYLLLQIRDAIAQCTFDIRVSTCIPRTTTSCLKGLGTWCPK